MDRIQSSKRKLILHRRFEIGLHAVAGTVPAAIAGGLTVAVATDPQRDAASVVLVALFAVVATLACVGAVTGIGECGNDIRRASR